MAFSCVAAYLARRCYPELIPCSNTRFAVCISVNLEPRFSVMVSVGSHVRFVI